MEQWLLWATELQSIAQAGLAYTKNDFDRERFVRIRELAAEMMVCHTDLSIEKVKDVFCGETGYQTPKIDTRAAIIKDDKIVLVKERLSGEWSLPGGWADINQSLRSNVIKEVKEEAGLDVIAERLIAVHDRNRRNTPIMALSIWKLFVLCRATGGVFAANIETEACGYFGLDELPPLSLSRNTKEQIEMCFAAYRAPDWRAMFD